MNFKLDNVTSLTTARWAAAEGFTFISFNFDKNDTSYIPPMQVAEICKWINGVRFIGSFTNVETHVILDLYELLNLDAIEIDLETAESLLLDHSIPSILRLNTENLKQGLEFKKYNADVFAFSINTNEILPNALPVNESFLPRNTVPELLEEMPFGINFNSENETEPGIVDFEELENSKNLWQSRLNCS